MSPPVGGQGKEYASLLRPNRHLFNHGVPAAPINNDMEGAGNLIPQKSYNNYPNTLRSSFDRNPFSSNPNSIHN